MEKCVLYYTYQNEREVKGMNENVKKWYMEEYPTDELGIEINELLTFENVADRMKNGEDIYDILNVEDSIVRERVFEQLSKVYNTDYDYWYYLWLAN